MSNTENCIANLIYFDNLSKLNLFQFRILLSKRDFVECIVSACIHRFGDCDVEINFYKDKINTISNQNNNNNNNENIETFWRIIDYNDFITRPSEYGFRLSKFLGFNNYNDSKLIELIENVLSSGVTKKSK